jgi:alpha-glucosidase
MKSEICFCIYFFLITTGCSETDKMTVTSPAGNNKFTLISGYDRENGKWPAFTLEAGNKKVLLPSFIQLVTGNNFQEIDFNIIEVVRESVSNQWTNNFGERKIVPDNYNQIKVFLESNDLRVNLICRAYNEGIAFAYEFPEQEGMDSVTITDEKILFRFPADYVAKLLLTLSRHIKCNTWNMMPAGMVRKTVMNQIRLTRLLIQPGRKIRFCAGRDSQDRPDFS